MVWKMIFITIFFKTLGNHKRSTPMKRMSVVVVGMERLWWKGEQ